MSVVRLHPLEVAREGGREGEGEGEGERKRERERRET